MLNFASEPSIAINNYAGNNLVKFYVGELGRDDTYEIHTISLSKLLFQQNFMS